MNVDVHALSSGELMKLYWSIGWELFSRHWFFCIVMALILYFWLDIMTDRAIERFFRCICNKLRRK